MSSPARHTAVRIRIAILSLLLLAGCGHSHAKQAARHPPSAGTARKQAVPRDREPHGLLSAAEYRSIVLEYTLLKPLQSSNADPGITGKARVACGAAAHPNTRLMELVQKDCLNAIDFFATIRGVENAVTVCAQGDAPVRDRCFSDRYGELANSMRATVTNALAINKELKRRGIGGVCARSIGIPRAQVVSMTAAAVAAEAASQAATNQDDAGFLRAQHLLSQALARQPTADPLAGIKKSCPHEGPKLRTPTLPAPQRKKKQTPHRTPGPRKPHVPKPGEGINA